MAQFVTLFEVGDKIKTSVGARRNCSFRVDEIRILALRGGRVVVNYRAVFTSGVKGGWIDEKKLELVERGQLRGSVRDFREGRV
jgi:hypothetical protein